MHPTRKLYKNINKSTYEMLQLSTVEYIYEALQISCSAIFEQYGQSLNCVTGGWLREAIVLIMIGWFPVNNKNTNDRKANPTQHIEKNNQK